MKDEKWESEQKRKELEREKEKVKNATLKLNLKSDEGYRSIETVRISANQWGRISAILYEK